MNIFAQLCHMLQKCSMMQAVEYYFCIHLYLTLKEEMIVLIM